MGDDSNLIEPTTTWPSTHFMLFHASERIGIILRALLSLHSPFTRSLHLPPTLFGAIAGYTVHPESPDVIGLH